MSCKQEAATPERASREAKRDSDRERDATVKKLDELERSASETKARLLYLRAEMDNYRKSVDREIEELMRSGNMTLLGRLFPVVRMLDFAIRTAYNEKNEPMATGLQMIAKQLSAVFEKYGMKGSEAAASEGGHSKESSEPPGQRG